MGPRTKQANCPQLLGQETVRTCEETFMWNGGQDRPTVLCCRDRKLREHSWKLSYGMEEKAVQLSSVVETGNFAKPFQAAFLRNGRQGKPTVLCSRERQLREAIRRSFPTEWRTRQTSVISKFETSQATIRRVLSNSICC